MHYLLIRKRKNNRNIRQKKPLGGYNLLEETIIEEKFE